MPRKNAPPVGAGKIVSTIRDLIQLYGGKPRYVGKALGINPSYAGKIIKAISENKSSASWIGTRGSERGEKNLKRFNKLVKRSGIVKRERQIYGKKSVSIIPPKPKRTSRKAEIIKQKQFIKDKKTGKRREGKREINSRIIGDSKKTVYKYDPARKLKIPKKADIQLWAIGNGTGAYGGTRTGTAGEYKKRRREKTKQIFSTVTPDWSIAWASLQETIKQTKFTVNEIRVIVIEDAPLKKRKRKKK